MIETQENLPGQNILASAFVHVGSLVSMDAEDLKGLREWVMAKHAAQLRAKENGVWIYSAPWRVG